MGGKTLILKTFKTMAILRKTKQTKIEIDLKSPQGNAFFLIGSAQSFGKQLGMEKEEINAIVRDMTSGNYKHLISVFDKNFGDYIDLIK